MGVIRAYTPCRMSSVADKPDLNEVVVMKFGGSLLSTSENIKIAAKYVIDVRRGGELPVVVVSAMSETTDQFIELAHEICDAPDKREMDMLLSVGERVSIALMAMAINADAQFEAVSYTGSQVGIITDTEHTNASIVEVRASRLIEALEGGKIPIIAGFQGISTDKEITTLGRGGSDTTAVALAVALKAKRCELIKEHGGVFSADPLIEPSAIKRDHLNFATLELMTASGAKIVQPRAAALARQHNVVLSVKKPDGSQGTLVSDRSLSSSQVASISLEDDVTAVKIMDSNVIRQVPAVRRFTAWADDTGYVAVKGTWEHPGSFSAGIVSIIGWGGVLPKQVVEVVLDALDDAVVPPIALIGMGGRLALLTERNNGKKSVNVTHEVCRVNGFL